MKHLIDKDALVAEIKRRISLFKKEKKTEKWSAEASQMNVVSLGARIAMLEEVLSFIDIFEEKEVDLEKELDKFYGMYRKDGQTFSLEDNEECIDWKAECNPRFEIAFAKHFFELGLKAQKG